MISVDQALHILRSHLPAPRTVHVSLEEAFSRRLSEDILAPEPSPRYTNSAMDGFAVRWQDVDQVNSAGPVLLRVAGESQAGIPYAGTIQQGEAIRISTGAMIPDGADTVIRVEDTEDRGTTVLIHKARKQFQDVRSSGEEFGMGDMLIARGTVLQARQIALLSAVGMDRIPVYARPRVSLFITGTELARHDDKSIKPYQVRDANTPMLQSAVLEAGGTLTKCLHVEDDLESTINCMSTAVAQKSDIILCSGGVSVGRHDHVKAAAARVGFQELFWRIRQKPGKPLYVAQLDQTLLFGLPGNPVSAFMCFQNFVMPTMAALQGVELLKKTITAQAENEIFNHGKRTDFLRVNITSKPNTTPTFRLIERQGSHMLTSIVDADGYIALEPGSGLQAGDLTEVYAF